MKINGPEVERKKDLFLLMENLPDIDIAVRVPKKQFIARIVEIANSSDDYAVEVVNDCITLPNNDLTIANVHLAKQPVGFIELNLQFISDSSPSSRVRVELRAVKWPGCIRPTRIQYIACARDFVCPLLSEYNRVHQSRYRIRVATCNIGQKKPTKRTLELFESFSRSVNKELLHPLDYERLYKLARQLRQDLDEHDIASILQAQGFSERNAEELASLLTHLLNFKSLK